MLDQTVRVMTDWGFDFEKTKGDDGRRFLRVTNPDHTPSERSGKLTRKRPLKAKAAAKKAPAKRVAVPAKQTPAKKAAAKPKAATPAPAPVPTPKLEATPAVHLLPPTGSSLMVYVQKVDDDGGVILGLKGESGSWLARVEGYTEVELVPT